MTTPVSQIVNNAAKIQYMSGGEAGCPLVIRTPGGGGSQLTAQHVPVLRVGASEVPLPYAKQLERAALLSDDKIAAAVASVLDHA